MNRDDPVIETSRLSLLQAADELMYSVKVSGKRNIFSKRFPEKNADKD